MKWDVEYTDEFEMWWSCLSETEQDSVQASVMLLGDAGPHLGFPHTSDIKGSRHGNLLSYEYNTQVGLIVCSMRLIHAVAPSC